MRKKVLFTILLIIIIAGSVYVGNFLEKEISTKKVEKNNKIEIKTVQPVISDEIVEKEDEKNVDEEQIIEEKVDNTEKEQKKSSNSSAGKSNSSKTSKSKNNESSKTIQNEESKNVQGTNDVIPKEDNNVLKSDETKTDDKKIQEEKTEESTKTVEIIIEKPKKSDYENDPVYLQMKKELFSSNEDCTSKGIELSFKDKANIASTMCTSESYKGKEVGYRLFIRYKDGTYKEYKK